MEFFALSEAIPQEFGTVAVVVIFIGFLKWAIDKVDGMIDSIHKHHRETNDKLHSFIKENTDALHELQDAVKDN